MKKIPNHLKACKAKPIPPKSLVIFVVVVVVVVVVVEIKIDILFRCFWGRTSNVSRKFLTRVFRS
jgi:hypothetical protein